MTAGISVPAALVFDMDGLLLDTERIALDGFLHACHTVGVRPNVNAYYRCIGTRMRESRQILVDGHGPDFPFDAVYAAWGVYWKQARNRSPAVKDGARAILATARGASLPCALATSSREPDVSALLAMLDLDEFFAVKVTGDRVVRAKPHPEIYRTAAAELGIEPRRCWALEDSANGVRSAHAAGFTVFQIPDLVPPDDELRALGHTVLPSLDAVDALLRECLRGSPAR